MGDEIQVVASGWLTDDDYEEYTIKEVELRRETDRKVWVVSLDHDMKVEWERGGGRPQPKVGDVYRFYGDIEDEFGARGVVDPSDRSGRRIVHYRDEAAQEVYIEKRRVEIFTEREKALEADAAEHAKRLSDLPSHWREHYETARSESEDSHHWDVMKSYDQLVICEHAAMLEVVFETNTVADLETFAMIPQQSKISSVWQTMAEVTERLWVEDKDPRLSWLQVCMERRWTHPLPTATLDGLFELVFVRMRAAALH